MEKKKWIDSKKYEFDFQDLLSVATILAIVFTFMGLWVSTILFVITSIISVVYCILKIKRYNILFLHLGLLVFNLGFLLGWL